MAFLAPTAAGMAGLGLIGTGVSAFGQYQAGQDSKKAGEYNAAIAMRQAEERRRSGELVEYQQRKNLEATVGNQAARYAGSGISVTTGSPISVMTDTLAKGYLDIAIESYNNSVAARNYESQAAMSQYEGKQSAKRGTTAAALTLLKGFGGSSLSPLQPSGYSTGY